jgi:hypothetical protein
MTEMIEFKLPLSCDGYHFVGKKPTAVIFADERVEVKTWRQVFAVVLSRCNQQCHERLMYLRNKVAGRDRLLLSDNPDGLRSPVKVDDELYAASGYGSATMMHILCDRILNPAGFDYYDISISLK